jgi:tetratricopeptide (TPR) repeat protein
MRRTALLCGLLVLATASLYVRSVDFDFVSYDDGEYVHQVGPVRAGLTPAGVVWAFTERHGVVWQPLTWLSHMLDFELYGDAPAGHHLTSVLLHLLNTLLLFGVLRSASREELPSAFVAALFALHPLHVESVAWVAERKDVLSTSFGLLSLGAYVAWTRHGGLRRQALTAGLLALGLLAKPMLVTLPFVFVLLDAWPLGRLRSARELVPRLREKIPYFALAGAMSLVTLAVQRGAMEAARSLPFPLRLANALVAYAIYLRKTVWPIDLAVHYPHPWIPGTGGVAPDAYQVAACALLLIALSVLALRAGREHRYAAVGWLWFLVTLLPTIGLVQVGTQALADRYTYVPLIGIFIAVAWGGNELLGRWGGLRRSLLAAGALAACSVFTWFQVGVWRDSLTLFEHALAVHPRNTTMLVNLGAAQEADGRVDAAIGSYRRAIAVNPSLAAAHYDLGNALRVRGDLEGALRHTRRALEIRPHDARARTNLAGLLLVQGRPEQAIPHLERALEQRPGDRGARANLALAHRMLSTRR